MHRFTSSLWFGLLAGINRLALFSQPACVQRKSRHVI
jgi:hypothetical protein